MRNKIFGSAAVVAERDAASVSAAAGLVLSFVDFPLPPLPMASLFVFRAGDDEEEEEEEGGDNKPLALAAAVLVLSAARMSRVLMELNRDRMRVSPVRSD